MNLTIERSVLLSALTRIGGVVSRKNTIPILSCVMLDTTGDGRLLFRSTNLDMEATGTTAATITQPGTVCVSAEKLTAIAKNASEGADISMVLDTAPTRLIVKSGRSRFSLATLPPIDFPVFPAMDDGQTFTLQSADLERLLSWPSFAMGKDAGRAYLQTVAFFHADGALYGIATNGMRLASASVAAPDIGDFGVLVPEMVVNEVRRGLASAVEEVVVCVSGTKISITTRDSAITSKLLDYKFTDYRRVIPVDFVSIFTASTADLSLAIRRAMIAVADMDAHGGRMVLTTGAARITARTSEADAEDEIECGYKGDELIMGINTLHMLEALSSCGCATAEICLTDKRGPMVIRPEGDGSLINVIMPLRGE